jgi:trigger factor
LIEGRAMAQSDIKITFEDLKAFTTKNIRQQMAQFGQTNLTKKFKELLQEFCLTKTK